MPEAWFGMDSVEGVLRAMYDRAKPWISPFQCKYGRRIPFASHKLEALEKRREKKKGSLGAFSTLDYWLGVIIVTGQNRVHWRIILTCACVLL